MLGSIFFTIYVPEAYLLRKRNPLQQCHKGFKYDLAVLTKALKVR